MLNINISPEMPGTHIILPMMSGGYKAIPVTADEAAAFDQPRYPHDRAWELADYATRHSCLPGGEL